MLGGFIDQTEIIRIWSGGVLISSELMPLMDLVPLPSVGGLPLIGSAQIDGPSVVFPAIFLHHSVEDIQIFWGNTG